MFCIHVNVNINDYVLYTRECKYIWLCFVYTYAMVIVSYLFSFSCKWPTAYELPYWQIKSWNSKIVIVILISILKLNKDPPFLSHTLFYTQGHWLPVLVLCSQPNISVIRENKKQETYVLIICGTSSV